VDPIPKIATKATTTMIAAIPPFDRLKDSLSDPEAPAALAALVPLLSEFASPASPPYCGVPVANAAAKDDKEEAIAGERVDAIDGKGEAVVCAVVNRTQFSRKLRRMSDLLMLGYHS